MRMRISAVGVAVVVLALIAAAVPAAAESLSIIVALGSIVIFGWAVIGLMGPHLVGLPGRWHAIGLLPVSAIVLIIGAVMLPEEPPPTVAELEVAAEEPELAEEHEPAVALAATAATQPDPAPALEARNFPAACSNAVDFNANYDCPTPYVELAPPPDGDEMFSRVWQCPATKSAIGMVKRELGNDREACAGAGSIEWVVAERADRERAAASLPPEPTTEQKLAALDRLNAASNRVGSRNVGDKQEVCAARFKLRCGDGLREVHLALPSSKYAPT